MRGAANFSPESVLAQVDGDIVRLDRATVHRHGLRHYCVHLLCVHQGLVYLQRRSATRHRNPDSWTSTVSGHISANDAEGTSFATPTIVIDAAAISALRHEYAEELGTPLPVGIPIRRVGEVSSLSRGGGEICNCSSVVFIAAVRHVSWKQTAEVQEVCAFGVRQIVEALQRGQGLPGTDDIIHPFADNFAPVFGVATPAIRECAMGA